VTVQHEIAPEIGALGAADRHVPGSAGAVAGSAAVVATLPVVLALVPLLVTGRLGLVDAGAPVVVAVASGLAMRLAGVRTRTAGRPDLAAQRVLTTVLFTDIVDSTSRAAAMGDAAWRELLDRHDAAVRRRLARFQGDEVVSTGDGFLATFDGPARAVRCALAITAAVRELGLEVRVGVHTGEVERRGANVGGLGVHIGARVASLAGPGEVLVSHTVKGLVAGAGLGFVDKGPQWLKGVPEEWRVYAALDPA
jgi:class 3 adenylate cyclase